MKRIRGSEAQWTRESQEKEAVEEQVDALNRENEEIKREN
jgi:hypothetical protein